MKDEYSYAEVHDPRGRIWWHVRGGDLPSGLQIRVAVRAERLHVIGLRIENSQPITSSDLRRIPLGDLASQLWTAILDGERRARWHANSAFLLMLEARKGLDAETPPERRAYVEQTETDFRGFGDDHEHLQELIESIRRAGSAMPTSTPRTPGAAPATDDELRSFARDYLEQIQMGMRGAVTRTARARSISRSTVYRWIEACRERGHLPASEEA